MMPEMNDDGCSEYHALSRRRFISSGLALGAGGFLGLLDARILFASPGPRAKARSVILLWMRGGQSHIDTWDPKPGVGTGGPFSAIPTAVKDIKISEHLPLIARSFRDISLIRSLTSSEGSHERATYLLHTGYQPTGGFQHASLGSVVTKMKGRVDPNLPPYVTIGGLTWPAGYLGSRFAPFHIPDSNNPAENLGYHDSVDAGRFQGRLALLNKFDESFRKQYRGSAVIEAYADHYQSAYDMMRSKSVEAFNLSLEAQATREMYGVTYFGQGCLLARRLVQAKVRFVEVSLPGWDTHSDNFETIKRLSREMDQGVSALIADLRKQSLLDSTLVLLCSEFGRTPEINANQGRDHYPRVWSAMLAGGGIQGGRVFGESTPGGEEVAKDPCPVGRLHATLCHCLDIESTEMNFAPDGRPIRVVQDKNAKPVHHLLV